MPQTIDHRKRNTLIAFGLGSLSVAGTCALDVIHQEKRSALETLNSLIEFLEPPNIKIPYYIGGDCNEHFLYAEFRGTTYRFYRVTATEEDNGVGLLIENTMRKFNPEQRIENLQRAIDLFNYFHGIEIEGLESRGNLVCTNKKTPIINPSTRYEVPLPITPLEHKVNSKEIF